MTGAFRQRCYLVRALAPSLLTASQANNAFNAYIEDGRRGVVVFTTTSPPRPTGVAVIDVRSETELAMLDEAGPLADGSCR